MSIDEQIGHIVLAHQEEQRVNLIKKNLQKGKTPEDVADFLDIPLSQVLEIQRDL